MTELDNTKQSESSEQKLSFGERLCVERKRQNISVADVAKSIHLSEQVIDAIDRSAVDELPQPTFVQGYLRVYAKYLGISDTLLLEEYALSVPHQKESNLQPRSTLPDEASSNSPFVKMITISLLVMMLVAALYASFSYYKNAIVTGDVEHEVHTTLPENEQFDNADVEYAVADESPDIAQDVQLVENKEIVQLDSDKQDIVEQEIINNTATETAELLLETVAVNVPSKVEQENTANQRSINKLAAEGDDTLDVFATQESWLEIDDANGNNLYYSLLAQDQQVTLKGSAPFKVFLGNAPHVKLKINDLSVYIEKYIRSNNIALFKISVDQQQVVFH